MSDVQYRVCEENGRFRVRLGNERGDFGEHVYHDSDDRDESQGVADSYNLEVDAAVSLEINALAGC